MHNFYAVSDTIKDQDIKIRQLIESALSDGLSSYDNYYRDTLPDNNVHSFINAFENYQSNIFSAIFLENPAAFHLEQDKLYQEIYALNNNFSDQEKLFFEFILGLCRFALAIKIMMAFARHCVESYAFITLPQERIDQLSDDNGSDFWSRLRHIALLGKQYMHALINATDNYKKIDFWDTTRGFFNRCHNLEQLAKYLASMQYVPQDKKFIGMAQILHWGGFGGSGEFIEKYTRLQALLAHRIGYHDRESGGFNARLTIIFEQLSQLKAYAIDVGSKLLMENNAASANIKILDVGSGPEYATVSSIVTNLRAKNRNVELAVSDVDTRNLLKLKQRQSEANSPIAAVYYFDLNFTDAIALNDVDCNKYDALTATLVLHQLDFAEQINAFRFFMNIVKPGGYILNADVGTSGYYHVLLASANLVDREGCMPPWQQHDFDKFSLPLSDDKVKIMFPLHQLNCSFPNKDIPFYAYMAYQVLIVPKNSISELNGLWKNKHYAEAAALVKVLSERN